MGCSARKWTPRQGQSHVENIVAIHEQSDEQLAAEAAREGSDGPAFNELLQRYRQRVWRICYRLLGNEHDAHDAAQEVFVRLFVHRDRYAGRSRYGTWVHGVAVRTCLGIRRSRSRRRRHEQPGSESAAFAEAQPAAGAAPGLALDLLKMLDLLDEEDRAMILLKYAEDYSYDELAEIFDLSVSACKMRIARARQRIQSQYSQPPGS